jgi:alkylation response protein AidB-like acyl-CoA dehydrogenase
VRSPGGGIDRDEFRRWLDTNWDEEIDLVSWRRRLHDARWLCPTWPPLWGGRDSSDADAATLAALLDERDVPGAADGLGMRLAAPTMLAHASHEVAEQFLVATATGEFSWCQLFSEPDAGSDLASLSTKAERDGDSWIITGQKVWTTSATHADVGLLLARTSRGADRHDGITCFILPMRQDGVEVRPLHQMNGHASFNEVFFDRATIPPGHVIGATGDGWRVALTTLAHERRLAPMRGHGPSFVGPGRARTEAAVEGARAAEPYRWYPQRAGRADLVVPLARASAQKVSAPVRQHIAHVTAMSVMARLTAIRASAARQQGRAPGPEGSLGKLASSVVARAAAHAHSSIAGAAAMLTGASDPSGGVVAEVLTSVPAVSIAGGTDEIQHNIIGERVLGLPREPTRSAVEST